MRSSHQVLFALALCLGVCLPVVAQSLFPRVIYGEDNRKDYFEVSDPQTRGLADATVALIRSSNLERQGEIVQISTKPYGQSLGLCPGEPFYSQETAAVCSGFLVAPDLVVTAGHCMDDAETCQVTSFVFGFRLDQPGAQPHTVPADYVFHCKEIVHSVAEPSGEDFAVVRLDRAVDFVKPVPLRTQGTPAVGMPLEVMGHPMGLPLKIADGANVRAMKDTFLVTNTDTFAGNSGSAVFNSVTGEVEGILVRGDRDLTYRDGCVVSNVCPQDGCRGEDATLISRVLPYLH